MRIALIPGKIRPSRPFPGHSERRWKVAQMSQKNPRKKYFVHASSQGAYLALAILPALVMSLFCIIFIFTGGERILKAAKEKPSLPLHAIRETVGMLAEEDLSVSAAEGVSRLRTQLDELSRVQESGYAQTIRAWQRMKLRIYIILFFSMGLVALLALQFSHRIAGPMVNLRRNAERLAAGKDTPPIHFRKHDEFQEIAAALEGIRLRMEALGAFTEESATPETKHANASKEAELVDSLR